VNCFSSTVEFSSDRLCGGPVNGLDCGLFYKPGKLRAVSWQDEEEKDHLEDQGVDGRTGSEWTLGRLVGGCVEWIHLAQDMDHWRAVVNAVMNLRVLAPRS
jgi:hypothetical protein